MKSSPQWFRPNCLISMFYCNLTHVRVILYIDLTLYIPYIRIYNILPYKRQKNLVRTNDSYESRIMNYGFSQSSLTYRRHNDTHPDQTNDHSADFVHFWYYKAGIQMSGTVSEDSFSSVKSILSSKYIHFSSPRK